MEELSHRAIAAKVTRQLLAGQITYKQFLDDYPDDDETDDKDIHKLFALIEHEPKVGGLFGVSNIKHEEYMNKMLSIISVLEENK